MLPDGHGRHRRADGRWTASVKVPSQMDMRRARETPEERRRAFFVRGREPETPGSGTLVYPPAVAAVLRKVPFAQWSFCC